MESLWRGSQQEEEEEEEEEEEVLLRCCQALLLPAAQELRMQPPLQDQVRLQGKQMLHHALVAHPLRSEPAVRAWRIHWGRGTKERCASCGWCRGRRGQLPPPPPPLSLIL